MLSSQPFFLLLCSALFLPISVTADCIPIGGTCPAFSTCCTGGEDNCRNGVCVCGDNGDLCGIGSDCCSGVCQGVIAGIQAGTCVGVSPSPAKISGDPHFIGFDGRTSFEFQGINGAFFSIYSSKATQWNAGLHSFNQSDATFVQSVGVKVAPNVHATVETSAECITGNSSVPFNATLSGKAIEVGGTEEAAAITVVNYQPTAEGARKVRITTSELNLTVIRAANSCHLDVEVSVIRVDDANEVDGVLGQTMRCRDAVTPCNLNIDEGSYLVSSLLAHDAPTNKYKANAKDDDGAKGRVLVDNTAPVAAFSLSKGAKNGININVA